MSNRRYVSKKGEWGSILKCIEAVFQVTTPLFMSGSNQKIAEFRIPSFLGALRFWYRATAPVSMVWDITKLREAEANLFGSSGSDTGQAAFMTRVDKSGISYLNPEEVKYMQRPGINYLGYGLFTRDLKRGCITEGSVFTIKFIIKPQQNPDIKGLIRALKALGLFGGCGSRSRRGFGSLTLISLKDETGRVIWKRPLNREQLQTEIKNLLDDLHITADQGSYPSYTAFSPACKIVITRPGIDPLSVLNEVGSEMIRYRSYGQKDRNSGEHLLPVKDASHRREKAKQLFADDHDVVLSANPTNNPGRPPRRVVFGLPHNYYFGSIKKKMDITGDRCKRRGSPLLIHIHALDKQYVGVLTYLPAQFLPKGEQIVMESRGVGSVSVPAEFDEQVIPDFLDSFTDRLEVVP